MSEQDTKIDSPESSGSDDAWKRRFDDAAEAASSADKDAASNGDLPDPEKEGQIPLPKVDFSTFLLSLASSALVHLGEVPNPDTGKGEANTQLAKHTIDIICMLQDKIQNGLNAEEARLLEGVLYELRMKYVLKVS